VRRWGRLIVGVMAHSGVSVKCEGEGWGRLIVWVMAQRKVNVRGGGGS